MTDDTAPAAPRLSAPAHLTAAHDFSAFDCGEPALDDWLRERALRNESHFSRTYIVCGGQQVVAYVSLSMGAVERADAPGRLRQNAPDAIPVAVIGRLAVSRSHAGRGLGADLLSDALRRVAVVSRSVGMAAVLVDAKDDWARAFYLRCAEFLEHPADSRTLFLPIATLVAAFDHEREGE